MNSGPARLRLHKLLFFSIGVDCFGPYQVTMGSFEREKVGHHIQMIDQLHLDLLSSIDIDSILMGLHRFIARRGKPSGLLLDQGIHYSFPPGTPWSTLNPATTPTVATVYNNALVIA